MHYKQLHIYRRSIAIKGCQKPWCRHIKNQKNAPRMILLGSVQKELHLHAEVIEKGKLRNEEEIQA